MGSDSKNLKICIIGGGVAGLSAANYLVDNNIKPILIESEDFGRQKVCGEFFSPEVVPILENWSIPFVPIVNANFITSKRKFTFKFKRPAASISRSLSEKLLSERAKNLGATLLINTKVKDILPSNGKNQHIIRLSNDEVIKTDTLIVAAGKLPFLNKTKVDKKPQFTGIKAHFANLPVEDQLYMYITPGAYFGVTSIENGKTNISCLINNSMVKGIENPNVLIKKIFQNIPRMNKQINKATQLYDWLITPIFQFGKKQLPGWPNTFFIGDAIAGIEPAAGNGLAMGISSGIMAGQYAISKSSEEFKTAWHQRYSNRLRWAKLLHYCFLRPWIANKAFFVCDIFPEIANKIYLSTREIVSTQ